MARRERRWYRRHSSGKLREIREYSRAFIAVFEATNVFLPAVILRESGKLYSHAHAANTEGSYLERCRGREREYVYVCERVGEKKDLLFLTWLLSATVLRSLHCLDVANRNAPWVYLVPFSRFNPPLLSTASFLAPNFPGIYLPSFIRLRDRNTIHTF